MTGACKTKKDTKNALFTQFRNNGIGKQETQKAPKKFLSNFLGAF